MNPTNRHNYDLRPRVIDVNRTEGEFFISQKAATNLDNGTYTCEATDYDFVSHQSKNKVEVFVGSGPDQPELRFFSGSQRLDPKLFTKKTKFQASCSSSGEGTTVTLYIDNKIVKSGKIAKNAQRVTAESPVYDMSKDLNTVHNKKFKCVVQNPWDSVTGKELLVQVIRKLIG